MANKRNKFYILTILLTLLSGTLIGLIFNFWFPKQVIENKMNITQNWIYDSIKERQILIKSEIHYKFNNVEKTNINYYNAYIYSNNQILIPLELFDNSYYINNKCSILSKEISYIDFKENNSCIKNVNDIWLNKKDISNIANINSNKIYGNSILCDLGWNFKLNSMNLLSKENFLRLNNYKYLYSSIYLENENIHFIIKECSIKDVYYNVINDEIILSNNIDVIINKSFSININAFIRNNGTIGSFIVDPIGKIIGIKNSNLYNNEVIFYA